MGRKIGKSINIVSSGVASAAGGTAGTTLSFTGSACDRLGYGSGVVVFHINLVGADAGTLSLTYGVKDCSTSTGSFATYVSASTNIAIATSATNTVVDLDVNLKGAERYIKSFAAATVAAGVTISLTALNILGEADVEPC